MKQLLMILWMTVGLVFFFAALYTFNIEKKTPEAIFYLILSFTCDFKVWTYEWELNNEKNKDRRIDGA